MSASEELINAYAGHHSEFCGDYSCDCSVVAPREAEALLAEVRAEVLREAADVIRGLKVQEPYAHTRYTLDYNADMEYAAGTVLRMAESEE
jgi:hypothetical protein